MDLDSAFTAGEALLRMCYFTDYSYYSFGPACFVCPKFDKGSYWFECRLVKHRILGFEVTEEII